MKKETILAFIKEYHQEKGYRRKYLPFFPSMSNEMSDLIQYTRSLYNHVHITESEAHRLTAVLMKKRVPSHTNPTIEATGKEDVQFDATLTGKIFEKIYIAMNNDPMLKQFKRRKDEAPLQNLREAVKSNFNL